ncbi:hypothetical protein QBC34DRAFT_345838 [Podospora aff. communis PSN243]|uniref:DUF7580 domain-containing protein n=1 Tax=Podospora aff. communis PSN243 TaxID=3040156 RepID=A0AAV9GZJ0_9PEZI|nr:hypothetical protein QBC34DRAFT_345838 [Podospora aff. communis PSN243]
MSGVEIAGLVLGAFPVAIWALERYREVARMMGFWYEIRLEYQRSSNELKFHRLSFIRNLKQLLLPVVHDDAQLQHLISDPGGDAWQDPEVQSALEVRLDDSYDLYLEILSEMRRVMQDLSQELAIDNDAAQPRSPDARGARTKASTSSRIKQTFDRSNRTYQAFRIKFSTGEQTRTRLFAEFQTYNDRLEKLMTSSDVVSELEETRQQQQSAKPAMAAITKFWGTAEKLYRALFEAWRCSCRDHHCAQLILRHRTLGDKDFQLHLDSGTHKVPGASLWSKYPMTIKVLEGETPGVAEMFGRISIQETTSVAIVTAEPKPQRRKMPVKSVHFESDLKENPKEGLGAEITMNSMVLAKSMTQTVTIHENRPPPSFRPSLSPSPPPSYSSLQEQPVNIITDLCHTLEVSVAPPSNSRIEALGYLRAEDSDTRFAIHSDLARQLLPDHCHIDLSILLRGQAKPSLTRRQRYRLSLVLASSFVQLKDTSWVQTPWDKRNVHFPSSHEGQADLESPFIVSQFKSPGRSTGRVSTDGASTNDHDVAGIACLGILLLELCFGRPIENHPSRSALPDGVGGDQIRAAFDLIAALEWLKEANDEAGPDYTEAVEWCLAGCRTLSREGNSWRKHMMERVVEPLERCYQYLG